ncbi:MAG: DUF1499 domain-containing protein [Pseudomonadota bacterium]
MTFVFIAIVIVVVAAMAYVRLAPTVPGDWHVRQDASAVGDTETAGSFTAVRQITAPAQEVLLAFEENALATPRTRLVAGNMLEGRITFETRSLIWGFPDFTTVEVQGDLLIVHGRLRFGRSDLGVNKARVQDWLSALGPLTAPL